MRSSDRFRLLIAAVCPAFALTGMVCATIGGFADLPGIARAGMTALSLAMTLMLPLGIACAILSWKMARQPPDSASNSQDIVEFLLGFAGFVMIILGSLFSPGIWWLAESF